MSRITFAREFLGVVWELATQVGRQGRYPWETLYTTRHSRNRFSMHVRLLPQKVSLRGVPELPDIGASAEGLTIIITGPTGGIGQQSAAELARRGAKGALRTEMERLGVGVWLNALPKRLGWHLGD